jgi:hypothetical protein
MGEFIRPGAMSIRDALGLERFLAINADGSINVSTSGTTALTLGTNNVVSVNNAETTILAANANRKNAIVQNHGASVLQIHFTAAQAFGAGPILLQQYQSWEAAQVTGVYQGIIYGIRAAATENAGRIEET